LGSKTSSVWLTKPHNWFDLILIQIQKWKMSLVLDLFWFQYFCLLMAIYIHQLHVLKNFTTIKKTKNLL
jgi:hypothetical protein